jgi:hypothetical protein
MLTLNDIADAMRTVYPDAHLTVSEDDGGYVNAPGTLVYWDAAVPGDAGWAYRTGYWSADGVATEETGGIDTVADVVAAARTGRAFYADFTGEVADV